MRQVARQFLDRKIGRRAFLSRFAEMGVAGAAASRIAGSLAEASPSPGRIVENMTGGEVMAELPLEWNAPYVFGLGGSEDVGFLDALVDRTALHFVTGLHEGSVMSMADGYARASGEVPLVNLHSIAGAGYAFGPMVNTFKDRFLSWSPWAISRRFGGTDELMEVAEILGAPVFKGVYPAHAPMTFPTTHPNYAGPFGNDSHYPKGFDAFWSIGGTMFLLAAHSPVPVVPRVAKVIHTGLDATEIGRSYPADVAMIANPRVAARKILEELRRRDLKSTRIDERRRKVPEYHLERRRKLDADAEKKWDSAPISIERLMVEVNRALDPGAIAVTELITAEFTFPAYFDIDHTRKESERRRNLTSCGGVLGWGVPAALGAKIARPDRQVAALLGDGSLQFGIQALWTAARYEIPVAIVVANNGEYQASRRFLHSYGRRAAATGKYVGCNLGSPSIDNVALAKGYGVEGERVEEPGERPGALARCLRAVSDGRAYVLDVQVERLFGGSDSTWYDFFSVAKNVPRSS
jgi:thiamine pyrophosphate-dependent acetolactate synthase large subunit-like protein